MFASSKTGQNAAGVDVNDFIVTENAHQNASLNHGNVQVDGLDISDGEIIDGVPSVKHRSIGAKNILTLAVAGIFAAGGVASIFVRMPEKNPAQELLLNPQ